MNLIHAHSEVSGHTLIRHVHILPRNAVATVKPGQNVKALENIATAQTPGEHHLINVARQLGVRPKRIEAYIKKLAGNSVDEGEVIAERRRFLIRNRTVKSPIDGEIIKVDNGIILLEGITQYSEIQTPFPGRITNVEPGVFIALETPGARAVIAWGHGKSVWGTLKLMDEAPSLTADPEKFNIDHRGAIVTIGAPITEAFLDAAAEIRVKGLIGSSMHADLIPRVEQSDFTVGVTQGFGNMPMSNEILSILLRYNGRDIALGMGSSADWRRKRPEIIIPLEDPDMPPDKDQREIGEVFEKGQRVRVLQQPHLGEIGKIITLPGESRQIESGYWTQIAVVEFTGGDTIAVPLLNLEYLG